MEIRALRPSNDRSAFESGDEALDRFFRKFAGQNQFRHYLGVTYVAVDGGRVMGFVTVAPGQIDIDDLPAAARKNLPHYPLPVLRLACLAVDRSARSQGLGTHLLRFVCRLAAKMADDYGCACVVVDAKPGAVDFYAKYGFATCEPLEGQSDARPQPTTMLLPMRAIKAASGTTHEPRSPSTPRRSP
jgi:predicted N-acetyltransferase YhbS